MSANLYFYNTVPDAKEDAILFSKLSRKDMTTTISDLQMYMTKKGDEPYLRPVTMWVVGDVERTTGRALLAAALKHMVTFNYLLVFKTGLDP